MIPKKHKLPVQDLPQKPANSKRSRHFTVKTFTSTLPYGRFGVVISKKTAAQATGRNRLKRIIFAAVTPLIGKQAGIDTLIIVSPAVSELRDKNAIIKEIHESLYSL